MAKHIRRTGILARLSPETLALLCPCDACFELRLTALEDRLERDQRNRHIHPLCPFCLSPMIWRGLAFICPYAETPALHEDIRRLQVINHGGFRGVAVNVRLPGGLPLQ